ncbi:MAG: aldehyde dehydrogenase family protein [Bdellovibrionales bacterium]
MTKQEIEKIHLKQTEYQKAHWPLTYNKRVSLLERLKKLIHENEEQIMSALKLDLNKSDFEAYLSELHFVVNEINFSLKNLKSWMKERPEKSPLLHFPMKSYLKYEPLGRVLIISPWNYPFQLLLSPLVGAMSAGCNDSLKPSEVAENTSKVIESLIPKYFAVEEVAVVPGAVEETTHLLDLKFDHIFYTGNGFVGRIVMEKAAKHLTPVTLELGGKSPAMVAGKVDVSMAAKRIVWGKFFNAGQTCIAPDYVLIEESKKSEFIDCCKHWIKTFLGDKPSQSVDYGRIINLKHFERLKKMIVAEEVVFGGETDANQKYISPTLLDATASSPSMKEEIFGPILPILGLEDFQSCIQFVRHKEKPLAAYLFTDEQNKIKEFTLKITAGGMCINDCLVHIASDYLPFGGVGESGMGSYHGKYSFECFSHAKAIAKRSFSADLEMKYPPYGDKLSTLKKLIPWV